MAKADGPWSVFPERFFNAGLDTETWRPVSAGSRLEPSSQLKTGADGWALLVRGKSDIAVMSNSHMAVPKPPRDPLATRIVQSLGTLLFRVEKRPGQRFEVETPYLIAGVKGTTFSVSVENKGATVSVDEGTVGVSAGDGGAEVDVTVGRTASVSSAPGAGVEVGPTPAGSGQAAGKGQPGLTKSAASTKGSGSSADAGKGGGKGGGQSGNDGNNGGGNGGGPK